ncbi:MarR family winged helix-turn-helix transcriptional regulator [Actinokineospora enzanensis]|uniref:MarR family winged helix-turn-helix transcriptional regulator n=1 Tax=Actinokineospora enzanensis TaxID=155975 RepID=UPI000381787A|nr:MarR family winged helix-turn-helix transcriptional regulator [Actinokineospora enzanensis]
MADTVPGTRASAPVLGDLSPDCTADDLATADDLGLQLVRLVRLTHHAKQQFTGQDPVERANYALLAALTHTGPLRANALAEAIHADPSTVSRQVSHLVGLGWLERRADPTDGRACVLAPTAEGHRVFAAARAHRTRLVLTLLRDWPETDRRTLVHLLTRFNAELESYQGEPE